jgi:hypothetical protein
MAPKSRRIAGLVCLAGLGLGLVMTAAGAAWSVLAGGKTLYSDEQAQEWDEASAAWHAATVGHAHGDSTKAVDHPHDRDDSVAAARERFRRADAALKSARFARDRLGPLLIWIGLAAAGAFGVGYLVTRSDVP